ncbi:uncharacterized protein LOC127717274 [Mytilus californianus]|uniref:uncharacterized protein LOC127717274 n=1 Tax=Mytilus californianus TaxID=6549 RepID=UPI002247FBB2|nr:uncharacterized protein LOC127717274 [Mytilus californianus]
MISNMFDFVITESPPNTSSDEERYSRLSIAIIETLTNILRDVITSQISASQMYQKCVPVLKYFSPKQETILTKLQYSNTYKSLDITLIYRLLRQFSLISQPTKGWGYIPDIVDITLGDDIERIRCYRNQIAHRVDTNIDNNEFNDYFDKFRNIGNKMDLYFDQKTDYERRIIWHKTCILDAAMQTKYENAMKEMEHIKLRFVRFEKRPVKFYWGESFDASLKILRTIIKDENAEGRTKLRLQIIFQNDDEVEKTVKILNSLKEEINEGLYGIEFIVAEKGSVILTVDILAETLETDEKLHATLALFVEKILKRITTSTTESIDMVVLPVEENTQWNKPKAMGEQVYLKFDIEAQLLETDEQMVEQLRKISDAILKHSNGSGANHNITATLLPINLEDITTTEENMAQAQRPAKCTVPVSVNLRQQLNIKSYKKFSILSCIKIGNTLAFPNYINDYINNQLIICSSDGTNFHHIPLHYQPCYITEIKSNTVAVSCTGDRALLIINISTGYVSSTINTNDYCYGISYYDNNLYVVIDLSIIHVMDLTGRLIRNITLPYPQHYS